MNRCLSEGRRSFIEHVAGIEAGAECERLAPQLSAFADREASAADLAALRPHLRTCLACRARLREFRAVPSQVAAVAPPAAMIAGGESQTGALRGLLESLVGAAQDKAAALGERAHCAVELATGQKVAAVAASAALAGGGGAAVDELREREAGAAPPAAAEKLTERPAAPTPPATNPEAPPPAPATPPPPAPETNPPARTAPAPAPAPRPPPPASPAAEFAPGPPAPAPAPRAAPPADQSASGGGGGEFGP